MTHEQKPESAGFRTREEQIETMTVHYMEAGFPINAARRLARDGVAEAEARGAAEQRRKDAASDPDDVTCALMDSLYVAGAKFGWNCGQDDDHASLHKMIEGRLRDRIEAGVSFSDRRKEKASTVHEHEQRRKDAEGVEPVKAEVHTEWFGWCEIPMDHFEESEHPKRLLFTRPANVAALEARVKELEGALKEAAYALERVKDGERGGYNARNGKFVSIRMSDGERGDIIHSQVTEDCERALVTVRAAIREEAAHD